jgi:hypothetical protein
VVVVLVVVVAMVVVVVVAMVVVVVVVVVVAAAMTDSKDRDISERIALGLAAPTVAPALLHNAAHYFITGFRFKRTLCMTAASSTKRAGWTKASARRIATLCMTRPWAKVAAAAAAAVRGVCAAV